MEYLRYVIKNTEPIRIADDSISQSGQAVSLRYIPGTTIRGVVVNSLVRELGDSFEKYKRILFSSKIRFLNAFLSVDDCELVPSPKGFYEDKTVKSGKKAIQNVVINGDFSPGFKRANLGKFCHIEDGCIYYYNINTGSDMKIRINHGDRAMFRNEYIMPGYTFVGYIAIDDLSVKELIESSFKKDIRIGNAKSNGFGSCKVIKTEFVNEDIFPYANYAVTEDVKDYCYMMLLSNTTMRNEFGEYAGINLTELESLMGVEKLKIEFCSTSTVNVRGYNRTLGIKTPSVTMYEMGSVFKLCFNGTLTKEKAMHLMHTGIGVRSNEGFGRVIILKDYEGVAYKQECSIGMKLEKSEDKQPLDDSVLKIVAANYARHVINQEMQKHVLSGINKMKIANSQVGAVRALLENNRYNVVEGVKVVSSYFAHASEKADKQRVQNEQADIKPFMKTIMKIIESELVDTLDITQENFMGYSLSELISEEEQYRMKFEYLIEMIKYDNRRGA